MLVYKDIISGDEMFTDAYPVQLIDDVLYKVKGKLVTETNKVDESALGANPSAEEEQEQCEAGSASGCNIVLANRLVETGFTKKDYKTYIKKYVGELVKRVDTDKQEKFKDKMKKAVQGILEQFEEFQFFQGESLNADGMVALMFYHPDDGTTPWMYFFKDGLLEEKQ